MRQLTPLALFALACASPGMPPGGPPDVAAPKLIGTTPDSGAVATPKSAVFRFDEVVAERPPAVTGLPDLFVISPEDGAPVAAWSREEVAVHPRRGWRRNTIYTVTMLPGMADLRGNVSRESRVLVFSTGGPIPRTVLRGRAWDWVEGRPQPNAFVQSISAADSSVFVTVADTTGAFTFSALPPGSYTVRAVADANRNRALDPREAWDSAGVTLSDTAAVDLFAFVHDSTPPRIAAATAEDSVTIVASFDPPFSAEVGPVPADFEVIAPDSTRVPVVSASVAVIVAPARRAPQAGAIPARVFGVAAADTTAPRPTRPSPGRAVRIVLGRPLTPGDTYRVRARAVRGLLGHSAESDAALRVPPRPAARADTTGVRR